MLLNSENIAQEKLEFPSIGEVVYNGQSIKVKIGTHEDYKIINLVNKTKSNTKPYQLGNFVKGNRILGSAMCETTKNGDPMISIVIKDRDFEKFADTKRMFAILYTQTDGSRKGLLSPSNEDENNNKNNING